MNKPKGTPEDDELILAFECYDFIVTKTDPTTERLYTDNPTIPPYIESQVKELEEKTHGIEQPGKLSLTSLIEPRHPCKYLSSFSINKLLIGLIRKNIPLRHETGGGWTSHTWIFLLVLPVFTKIQKGIWKYLVIACTWKKLDQSQPNSTWPVNSMVSGWSS